MLLKDYLKKENKTLRSLSKDLGVSESFIYQVSCGNKRFSEKMAIRIESLTHAEVTRGEIMWPHLYKEIAENGSEQMRFAAKTEGENADS